MTRPSESAQGRRAARRIIAIRLVVAAATATLLGVPVDRVQAAAGRRSVSTLAATRGVDVGRIRATAVAAAAPLLDEGVRAGDLTPAQRDGLRRQIEDGLVEG